MICPHCGRETADDREFCEHCRKFLRWDENPDDAGAGALTPVTPTDQDADAWPEPVEPEPVATEPDSASTPPPASGDSADRVVVTVRLPGDGGAAGETATVHVDAGGQAVLVGLVRNQSGIVDNYDLRVEGLRDHWWTVEPATLYLVPFGSDSGTHEQESTIRLHPPRKPQARAGEWPIELVVTSRAQETRVGSAAAALVIAPYEAFESRVRPERARGKRHAEYVVPVRNDGNADLPVSLRGEDPDGEVQFAFAPPALGIATEGEARSNVTASARRPLVGSERERPFTVFVEGPTQTLSGTAVFIQRPWLTRSLLLAWRIALTLLAAALLIGGAFLHWSDRDELTGVCLSADPSGCMRYDQYLDRTGYIDADEVAPTPNTIPATLDGPFNLATSLGFVTILLGVLALLGARSGTLTWLAGGVAVLGLVVFFITLRDASGEGAWIALVGGVCALAAGILASASRSSGR